MANPHAVAAIQGWLGSSVDHVNGENRFMPATGSGFAAPAMTKNLTASKNHQAMPRPGFA
jgi:hypothetical protein